MKVSLISAHMNALRGTELHVKDVCHSLVKDGHSVDLITGAKGIASDPLEVSGIKVIECPEILPEIKKPHAYLAGIFKLAGILRESKPDIVHAHGMGVEMVSRISSRLLGFPNVYTVHGWFFGHKGVPLREKISGGISHGIASIFNNGRYIFVSEADRKHGLKRGYVSPNTSLAIHNGIPDIPLIEKDNVKPDGRPTRLVMVSSLCSAKDHESVLLGLAKLKDLDWTIDFAGKGDARKYKKMAADLGIEDRCNFLGEQADIAGLLAHEDVFVLASHREGLPLSIIEAMRAQLPVIASDVGGVSELVSDGKTGYTFPHANVEILSQRLRELISDANLRSSMGSEGRKLYEEGFIPDQMMKRIYGVYDETIDNHKLHLPRAFLN